MAPEPFRGLATRCASLLALSFVLASPAQAFRIVNYNLLNYPSVNLAGRQPHFRTIMAPLGPDIVVTQEMNDDFGAGVDSFRVNVLNVLQPGEWASAPFTNGPDTNNGFFYRTSRVQFIGQRSFYVSSDATRLVNEYRVRPVGYASDAADFYVYSVHLKASTASGDVQQRLREATGLRDTINHLPPGSHAIVMGDYNFYSGTEPGLLKFLENQVDNDGRLYDPLGLQLQSWQDNPAIAIHHTQCPSTTAYRPSGSYAGGGMDDRFDLFLPTYNWNDNDGYELLESTYRTVGNDGLHLNKAVTDAPIAPADTAYARALWWGSDHMPIRVDLVLPSRASAPDLLAFGSVITGAPASQVLVVSNASSDQDSLDAVTYTLAPPAGFTAPGGTLNVAEGGASADEIGMDTATPGVKDAVLVVSTDDPDNPALNVSLTGTVLRHAVASLDSLVALGTAVVEFEQLAGNGFDNAEVRVHNFAWDALQARLALSTGAITGGEGRFSIVGGFVSDLLAGTGRTYSLAFDPTGATEDSLYEATLTFGSTDEALPGATPRPDLTVTLRATVEAGGTTGVEDTPPTATLLFAPFPNPLAGRATVRFDVARAGDVALEVFDLSGRRASTLVQGALEPGRYSVQWNGLGEDGAPVRAGLYFVRLTAPGAGAQSARIAVIR
jgi:endonuclease/exonuclease/phosphatase family metal-dependent hydrolase